MADDDKFKNIDDILSGNTPPAEDGNKTVLIPKPGSRRPAPPPVAQGDATVVGGGTTVPGKVNRGGAAAAELPVTAKADLVDRGAYNPIVTAAAVVLNIITRIRKTLSNDNIKGLHRELVNEIQQFESSARAMNASTEEINYGRYILCAVLDDVVLNTPWGSSSEWSKRTLLSLFHGDAFGGEKVFNLISKMLQSPSLYRNTLELAFICLNTGFEGQYRLQPNGQVELEHIRSRIFTSLEQTGEQPAQELSPEWETRAVRKPMMIEHAPVWVVFCVALAFLVVSYSGFRLWLHSVSEPTADHIEKLTQEVDNTFK